ncbi:(2Fe-2S)-binding protein [Paenibacillus xanthanilyticus]|uniref:(2Fe-2S)-binding protein n=1 Tax=Paenibacillus xanthanilyticus TaxID=1783531 RepID=A0ABV8JWC5_9BACL
MENMIDYGKLEQTFGIRTSLQEQALMTVPAADLLRPEVVREVLDTYVPLLQAEGLDTVGAIFGSTFGSFAQGYQAALSLWNRRLPASLDQVTLQLISMGTYYKISFVIGTDCPEGPTGEAEREAWVTNALGEFYHETILPIFRSIEAVSGMNIGHLWGQMPTYSNYYVEYLLTTLEDEAAKTRLSQDYELLKQLDPALLDRAKNPFTAKPRYIEDMRDCNKQVRMKNVCCMYYKTSAKEYCYTCPKLKENDREAKREAYRQANAVAAK